MPDPAPRIHTFPTVEAAIAAAANRIAAVAAESITARDRFSIALSGGSTPAALFRLLARDFRARIDWPRTHAWWGDERCVPHDHKDSNTRMARETLLDHVPIPASNVHTVPTQLAPAEAAAAYEQSLRAFDPVSPIDLVLLGMGTDGHTASLFPGEPTLDERDRWAVHATAPAASPVRDRITFTLPLIATGRHAMFLATGAEKRDMIARVIGARDQSLPAARVRSRSPVEWFMDRAASGAVQAP